MGKPSPLRARGWKSLYPLLDADGCTVGIRRRFPYAASPLLVLAIILAGPPGVSFGAEDSISEPAAVPPRPSQASDGDSTKPATPSSPSPDQVAPLPTTVDGLKRESLEVASRLAEDFPNRVDAIALLGLVYARQGESDKALDCWKRCLELDPRCSGAHHGMAWLAFRKAEYGKAIKLWREVLKIDPRYPGSHNFLARALLYVGQPEEAMAALKRDVEISPQAYQSHFLLGQRYLQAKEYQRAKECYEKAVEIEPDYANAYYGLATVCARLKQAEEAKRHREKFKELDAETSQALTRHTDEYDDLVFSGRNVARTHTDVGAFYRRFGKYRRAEQVWQRAAALDPKNRTCRVCLAQLYQATGRAADALRTYEQLHQFDPDNATILAHVGVLNARARQYDAAEEAFKKLVEVAPQRREGYTLLIRLYLTDKRNLLEAKRLAEKLIELAPTAEHYSLLGRVCAESGDLTGALAALKRAVEIDPDSEKHKRAYEAIARRNRDDSTDEGS